MGCSMGPGILPMDPGPEAREDHVLLIHWRRDDLNDAHGYTLLLQGDCAQGVSLQGVLSGLPDRVVVVRLQDGGLLYAEVANVPGDGRTPVVVGL